MLTYAQKLPASQFNRHLRLEVEGNGCQIPFPGFRPWMGTYVLQLDPMDHGPRWKS